MNSQEKELLLQAAKPLGYFLLSVQGNKLNMTKDHKKNFHWNPLTDDGDAFRLAVKLQMKVYPGEAYPLDSEVADYSMRFSAICDEDEEPDTYAATRKAITRAAAEIGRNMK